MLEVFTILVFAAHLLLVNLATMGPAGALWLDWRAFRLGDAAAGQAARMLVLWSLASLTIGMGLGGILLVCEMLHGNERYFEALRALPASRLWFALGELVFYYACLIGNLLMRPAARWSRVTQRVLAVLATTNLAYHFPPLLAMISTLATRPALRGVAVDRALFRALLVDSEILSRVVHVLLASVAVLGVAVMLCGWKLRRRVEHAEPATRLIGRGAWLALVPTLLQFPVGLWVFWQLPRAASQSLMGSDLVATILFAAALLVVLRMMNVLVLVALGDIERRQILECAASMAVVIALMTGTLHRVERHSQNSREIGAKIVGPAGVA